jgi:hypothetical protein
MALRLVAWKAATRVVFWKRPVENLGKAVAGRSSDGRMMDAIVYV